jgi:hypothetical protein
LQVSGLIAALLMMPLPLGAAEAESTDRQETVPATQTEENVLPDLTEPLPDPELTTEEGSSGEADNRDFVPSIRIVEDLPVSFPVDI